MVGSVAAYGKNQIMRSLLFLPLVLQSLPCQAKPVVLECRLQRKQVLERQKPRLEDRRLHVVLGTQAILVQEGSHSELLDFANRLIHRPDAQVSLYSVPGFRWAELQNRLMLGGALRAANITEADDFSDPVLLEHLFSVNDPNTATHPTTDTRATLKVSYKNKDLLRAAPGGTRVEPGQAEQFVRFLRYHVGGHPDALTLLQHRGVVPPRMQFEFYEVGRRTSVTLLVTSAMPGEEEPAAPPLGRPSDDFQALIRRAQGLQDMAAHSQAVQQRAAELLAQEKPLPAMLLFLGDSLARDAALPPIVNQNRQVFNEDGDTSSLFQHLSGKDEEASAALRDLEEPAGEALPVLSIFEGGVQRERQNFKEAQNLYVRALQGDPYLTGAWKDLGDLYYHEYECELAWQCWDTARHLCPHHKMLEDVNQLEKQLVIQCPGFF